MLRNFTELHHFEYAVWRKALLESNCAEPDVDENPPKPEVEAEVGFAPDSLALETEAVDSESGNPFRGTKTPEIGPGIEVGNPENPGLEKSRIEEVG